MRYRLLIVFISLACIILIAGAKKAVAAQFDTSAADVALLTASCSGCHAREVLSDDDFPQIYGLPSSEIREAMLAYRADELSGTVMNRIAKGYSEPEIDAMARFLAGETGGGPNDLAN